MRGDSFSINHVVKNKPCLNLLNGRKVCIKGQLQEFFCTICTDRMPPGDLISKILMHKVHNLINF